MPTPTRWFAALAVACGLAALVPAADDPPPREVIAKRAKASTVLVEVKSVPGGPQYGSAFCVHASGLFVTNDHVIGTGADKVELVLDAGLKTQRVLKAQVVRRDKALDLALLKVDEKCVPLELGSDKDLTELTEVVACGFPFGAALAREGEYPSISINVGSVTSLRNDKQGDLHRIQLDAALNPGNSGGPVLDRKGKVVGVVVSGIRGAGVNMAIPVSHVQGFLARPEVSFEPPVVRPDERGAEVEFTATAVAVVPAKDPVEIELVLGVGPGKERRFPMKMVAGTYRAKAVPFPAREGPPICRVEVRYADGSSVTGTTEDAPVRVGEKELKLSEVRALRGGEKVEARLAGGQRVAGAPANMGAVPVKVGKQTIKLDLADAAEVLVEPPEEVTATSCTIVAKQGDKELGRTSHPLYIRGLSRPSHESLPDGKYVKPPLSGTPVTHLRAVSTAGDYIGQGKSYFYGPDEFTVTPNGRGVVVSGGGWHVSIGAPNNRTLAVGEYDGAKRFAFSGDAPGIDFTGNGRGSNRVAGNFVVWEIEVKDNKVTKLAIDFLQRSEEKGPPLYGSLRVNSSFH